MMRDIISRGSHNREARYWIDKILIYLAMIRHSKVHIVYAKSMNNKRITY